MTPEPANLWEDATVSVPKRHYTAGGVVVDDAGRLLVIERDVIRDGASIHEVRLPKGHIDPGESAEDAALREVVEETGYCDLEIAADLGVAHSAFTFRGAHHWREERYFLMRLRSSGRIPPAPTGAEEALFAPRWMAPGDAEAAMTYPSEREFVRRARAALDAT